jgi:hypothetical protein
VARQLGIGRSTAARAVASGAPPKYERTAAATSFDVFEPRVRELLAEFPDAGDGDRRAGRLGRVDLVVPGERGPDPGSVPPAGSGGPADLVTG